MDQSIKRLSACAIIAEYNPFHNGHLHQLKLARQRSQADAMIVIMSGNWTQRGCPAIMDKWTRTKMALSNGADLVVELPPEFAVQPADLFASGGVQIAQTLKSKWLSFGCEHADLAFDELAKVALPIDRHSFQDYHMPYAAQFQKYLFEQTGVDVSTPNDVLAMSYARANHQLNAQLKLLPIQRLDSAHLDQQLKKQQIGSATAIRQALFEHHDVREWVPQNEHALLDYATYYNWQSLWPLVRFQLLEQSITFLQSIYQMNEGIEYRLKRAALNHDRWDAFLQAIKTKRYSYARLQRLLFYLLINASGRFKKKAIDHIRVLGFNAIGRQYLNQVKKSVAVPVITNPGKEQLEQQLLWTVKSGMLLEMQSGNYQDRYCHPIIHNLSRKLP